MKKRIFLAASIFLMVAYCKDPSKKNFKFGLNVEKIKVDTTGDGVPDTWGYYLADTGNFRIIYEEIDKNLDGFSDELIWGGSAVITPSNRAEKDVVKVHEETDTDYDGKMDTLRWLLPNELIALSQSDTDKDGYFESTEYYNFQKKIVRREKDTNKDGKPDQFMWDSRAEIDTNFDLKPDKFIIAKSDLEVQEKVKDKSQYKELKESDSWILNQNLIPQKNRAIIGSGYFNVNVK